MTYRPWSLLSPLRVHDVQKKKGCTLQRRTMLDLIHDRLTCIERTLGVYRSSTHPPASIHSIITRLEFIEDNFRGKPRDRLLRLLRVNDTEYVVQWLEYNSNYNDNAYPRGAAKITPQTNVSFEDDKDRFGMTISGLQRREEHFKREDKIQVLLSLPFPIAKHPTTALPGDKNLLVLTVDLGQENIKILWEKTLAPVLEQVRRDTAIRNTLARVSAGADDSTSHEPATGYQEAIVHRTGN